MLNLFRIAVVVYQANIRLPELGEPLQADSQCGREGNIDPVVSRGPQPAAGYDRKGESVPAALWTECKRKMGAEGRLRTVSEERVRN